MRVYRRSAVPYVILAVLGAAVAAAGGGQYPPAFPREGATKLLENDRIVVWDATWHKGRPTPLHEHAGDYLSVTLVQGSVKVTERDGSTNVGPAAPLGFVRFNPRGIVHVEEGVSEQERRAIMVELKDAAATARPSSEDGAGTFAGSGATKLIDNTRVRVWDYAWTMSQRVVPHRQTRATLVVFLRGGVIRVDGDGSVKDLRRSFGEVVYIPAGSEVGGEEALEGPPRAVFIELQP